MEFLSPPKIPQAVWDTIMESDAAAEKASGAVAFIPNAVKTVLCAAGKFEEHPESYSPRIFVRVMNPTIRHYELLQSGWILDWPSLPPEGSPDYMLFQIEDIHGFSKITQGAKQ